MNEEEGTLEKCGHSRLSGRGDYMGAAEDSELGVVTQLFACQIRWMGCLYILKPNCQCDSIRRWLLGGDWVMSIQP